MQCVSIGDTILLNAFANQNWKVDFMVIYFSGTGNSRYVAEGIALRTNDKLINANEYIRAGKSADFTSDAPFVFVSPTYAWRIPRIFSDFIENGTFKGNATAYFVMTCGTDIGNADKYLKELSAKKSLQYMGVKMVQMPENYVAVYDVTDKAESKLLISQSDKAAKMIAESITSGKALPLDNIGILAKLKSRQINPIFYSLVVNAKGFYVTDKCIGCGKCEELCPLNNIKIIDGKPVYRKNCTHCMACICACPTEAIEYNKHTIGKPRYYNTKVPVIETYK